MAEIKPPVKSSENPGAFGTAQTVKSEPIAKSEPADSDSLLKRAQVLAPSLTADFVSKYDLTDEELESIAAGLTSPPPVDDDSNSELHLTPGGWVRGPKGVALEDIGKTQISRGPQN